MCKIKASNKNVKFGTHFVHNKSPFKLKGQDHKVNKPGNISRYLTDFFRLISQPSAMWTDGGTNRITGTVCHPAFVT